MSIKGVSQTGVLEALRDRSLRTVNRVFWLSVLAFASVVALRQVREPFAAASDVGDLVLDLSIAYVAGWIFFI